MGLCLKASPAEQYLSIGLREVDNCNKLEWIAIKDYATNEVTSNPTPDVTTYQVEQNNATKWATNLFDDIAGIDWLSNPNCSQKTYMDALLATSLMRRHSSIDTKLGHVNESIIMNNALMESECNASLTLFKMDFACEAGLVSNLEQEYLHASPDYLILISKDDISDVAFAEIECRARVQTANLDRQLSNGVDKWI